MRKLLLLLCLVFVGTTAAQRPDAPEWAQRGEYPVGARNIVIEDDERPLTMTIWYPALNPDGVEETITYTINPGFTEGQAIENAAPDLSDGPYPVVLFSHGSNGLRLQSLFLTEHLASHGFVVVAMDHPGNTILDLLTDPDTFADNMVINFALRPLDVLRVIDFLDTWDKLPGLMDMERLAVAGHSFGGYTALGLGGARLTTSELMFTTPEEARDFAALRGLDDVPEGLWPETVDERIDAVVAMAPCCWGVYGDDGLASVDVDTLVVMGSVDPVTESREAVGTLLDTLSSDTRLLVNFENAGHYIFVDECIELLTSLGFYDSCSDDVWDMDRAHDVINHFVTGFLVWKFYDGELPEESDFLGVEYQMSSGN